MDSTDMNTIASAMESLSVNQNPPCIWVKVEDMNYQFPAAHFEHCNFQFVTEPDTYGDGSSPNRAITLRADMVSAEDLEDVLEILGISTFGSSDRLSYLPVGQWISGLKLAVRWAYDGLRDTAIFYLNQNQEFCSNPVQQILYGRDYGVEQWLIDGCSHFVLRSHGPREQEAIPLGMTTTIALYDMRESMSISGFNLKAAIKSTFEDYL